VWTLRSDAAVPVWRPDGDPRRAALLVFSTRRGGVSQPPYASLNLGRSTADQPDHVAENRTRLLDAIGVSPSRLVTLGQVHGADVARAEAPGFHGGHDAVVTRVPGLALAVTSADCLPILFSTDRAVGAAHAGWRGVASGVAEATLAALCEIAGVPPQRVRVHLGPCIRPCCYEVGPDVAERFPEQTLERRNGSIRLGLPAAVALRLGAAGLPPGAIADTGACTACEPFWYFSHRRDRGITGRHWGVVGLPVDSA